MLRARELNERGMNAFQHFLRTVRNGNADYSSLDALREDGAYSSFLRDGPTFESEEFTEKRELAAYVSQRLEIAGLAQPPRSREFWTWLAVMYFDSICPVRRRGSSAIREEARYVLSTAYNREYRHRIAGPVRVHWAFRDRPEDAAILLYGRPFELSDFEEQLTSRQQRIQNRSLTNLATRLYYDPTRERSKQGSQTRRRAGSLLRLIRVLEQLELTHDLFSMTSDQIMGLLPEEFANWIAEPE